MMILHDFTKKRIEKILKHYIEQKMPKHARDQVKLNFKIKGNHVTLFEERIAFRSDEWIQIDIAQFRFAQNLWKVYWRDSKDRWHFVEDIVPDEDFEKQLQIVDKDDRGMFWG